ncbi:transposase [Streptococcus danieliae]|uniref:Transposase n=2 Tax=Streptococcus danieliae TaxID=747656 RepID=A0A7Z0S4F2_9STRE|nr:transposase [Streptococcus danieliae]MBF0698750.1 transposase [Streptococcus danieliae]NYS95927.1 transposase [Streptococcus danieliae]
MNAAYDSMVKKTFPKARIFIDRLHIIQQLTNTFKNVRIQEMNHLNRHSGEEVKYHHLFKRYLSAQDIALKLIDYNPVLKETYDFYQPLLGYFKDRNADYFLT